MEEYSMMHIDELKKVVCQKKLIPFIGAGFSANIKGYPTWKESVRLLENHCGGCSFLSKNNEYLEAYQYAYWVLGGCSNMNDIYSRLKCGKKRLFRECLKETLEDPIKKLEGIAVDDPNTSEDELKQHELLVSEFQKIYTTNWDTLIEYTCDRINLEKKSYHATVGEFPYGSKYCLNSEISTKASLVKIIKYHGCVSDETCTSIVASSADYHERISSLYSHPLDQELYWDMRENSIMFLGYSLNDINIKYVMNQVLFEIWRQHTQSSSKFYLISLDEPISLQNVIDYWGSCVKLIPIYLFGKNHFYHNLVNISKRAIKEKISEPQKLEEKERIPEQLKMEEREKIEKAINIVGQIEEGALIKTGDLADEARKVLDKLMDDTDVEELKDLLRRMRKRAITQFLEYITKK